MPQPNWLVTLGLAKETTWGTAVNPATTFLSCPKPVFTPKIRTIPDTGLRGIRSQTQAIFLGEGYEEFDFSDMPWYGDDSGHLLMGLLGADAVTLNAVAKTGTIGAVSAGATSLTYTVVGGGAPVTGEAYKIDTGTPNGEIVVPTLVTGAGPYTFTVPAIKYAHAAATPAAGLALHTMSVLNSGNPPPYTFAKFDNLVATAQQIAGGVIEELTFKFTNPGLLTVSAKGRGKLHTLATKSTAVYSAEPFSVPWQAAFTIGGSANARVVDFECSIKAPADLIFGMAATQSPTSEIGDQIAVTGKFTVVPDDYTEFNYYLNNTQPAVLMVLDNGSTRLDLQMSKTAFIDSTQLDHGGNYSMLNATYEAVANATDAGTGNAPLKALLRNLKTGAY